ncbi:prepilin peptidase [Sphingomonas koreensis]|nr:prepilin peptidase [Sphingomonas koreensis]
MTAALAWPLALGLLGAIAGSFIAALVIRWPQERSVLTGRSACDGCARALGPVELIPLLSAALQRGRCRSCGAAIDPRHWQIEATALVIGVAAGLAIPAPVAAAGALFGWLLLALAALDVTAFWLPDRLTLVLALAGVATGALGIDPPLVDRLIGGAAGFAVLWAIARGYRLARGREGLGGGDPKLFGAIGLWLGWRLLPAVLVLACAVGFALLLVRLLTGQGVRGDDRLPFGALLAIAAYPAWLVMLAFAP